MRIAHWSIWAPNRSGMCHTTLDIVGAERAIGIDAAMIDAMDGKPKTDGTYAAVGHAFADRADVYALHLAVPQPYFDDGTPMVVFLHGHPLYSMQIELYGTEPGNERPFSTVAAYFKRDAPTWFVSFWEQEQGAYWEALAGQHKHHRMRYAPRGIEFGDKWTPSGPKRDLEGSPAIVIADSFRLFKDAIPSLWGAYTYWLQNPSARLHLYGLPPKGTRCRDALDRWIVETGLHRCIGQVHDVVSYLPEVFRAADVMVTTVTGESRTVLEAMACGCPVVAPWPGATAYTPEFWLPHIVARGIQAAIEYGQTREDRAAAVREAYDIRRTAEALSNLYTEMLDHGNPGTAH